MKQWLEQESKKKEAIEAANRQREYAKHIKLNLKPKVSPKKHNELQEQIEALKHPVRTVDPADRKKYMDIKKLRNEAREMVAKTEEQQVSKSVNDFATGSMPPISKKESGTVSAVSQHNSARKVLSDKGAQKSAEKGVRLELKRASAAVILGEYSPKTP